MTNKIDISISLEGEQAMKLLQALASITDATVAVEEVPVAKPAPKAAPKKTKKAKPKRTSMGTMTWTDEQLDYLSSMLSDFHAEHGKITFPAKSTAQAEEFYSLTGVRRTQKALNVRVAMQRKDGDKRFFPDGSKQTLPKGKCSASRSTTKG